MSEERKRLTNAMIEELNKVRSAAVAMDIPPEVIYDMLREASDEARRQLAVRAHLKTPVVIELVAEDRGDSSVGIDPSSVGVRLEIDDTAFYEAVDSEQFGDALRGFVAEWLGVRREHVITREEYEADDAPPEPVNDYVRLMRQTMVIDTETTILSALDADRELVVMMRDMTEPDIANSSQMCHCGADTPEGEHEKTAYCDSEVDS